MTHKRLLRIARWLALLAALATLGVIVLELNGVSVARRLPGSDPLSTSTPTIQPTAASIALPSPEPPTDQPVSTETPDGPSTPADEWANRIIDRLLPLLNMPASPVEDTASSQLDTQSGLLAVSGETILVGSHVIGTHDLLALTIYAPPSPIYQEQLGRVVLTEGALNLTINTRTAAQSDPQWFLSGVTYPTVISALTGQAGVRGLRLRAIYRDAPGREGQLVLSAVEPLREALTSTSTPTQAASLATTPTVPLPTNTPTPTRKPDSYLGELIVEEIDPVIDAAKNFDRQAVIRLRESHPWSGRLTISEAGPAVGGRSVNVSTAEELSFYTLAPDDPAGTVERFLVVTYNGVMTRLPEYQRLFITHRMEEILIWMLRHAASRGGQLIVLYDDLGDKQSITIIDFAPFETSSTPPP